MSDNRVNSSSSARIHNLPEGSELPAKSSSRDSNFPKVHSGSSVDGNSSLFAQEKKLTPLSHKLSAAIRLQSVQLIHALLSEAISEQDAEGLAVIVKSYKPGIQGGKNRTLLDQALNMRDKEGRLVILKLTNECFYKSSPENKQASGDVVHLVTNLLNSSKDYGQEALQPSVDTGQHGDADSSVSGRKDRDAGKPVALTTGGTGQEPALKTADVEYAITDAIANVDLERLENLLKAGGIDLNNFKNSINPPLHHAVDMGSKKAVELLLRYGAGVNLKNAAGNTALHFAAINGDLRTIKILMQNDADEEAINERGETPFASAARNDSAAAMQELIKWGADTGPGLIEMLENALKNNNADAAEVLVNTLIRGNETTVRQLANALYMVARHGGSRGLMRRLVNAGADINYVYHNGRTPLMIAAKSGHINAVRWLVKHHADLKMTDLYSQTSADLAKKYKQSEVAAFLEKSSPAE